MKERRRQKQLRTKNRILQAARELAQENGFENVSLRAIARRVDYSPASLYEYYASKDAIIDALCEQTEVQLADFMRTNASEDLVLLSLRYIQFAKENPDWFQLVYRRPMLPDQKESVPTVFRAQAQQDIADGTLRNCDADDVSYAFWAVAHGMALLALNRELHDDNDAYQQRILQRLLSSFQ